MGCNKILYISKFWKINLFCITTVLWFHSKQTRAILKNKFMIFYPDEGKYYYNSHCEIFQELY